MGKLSTKVSEKTDEIVATKIRIGSILGKYGIIRGTNGSMNIDICICSMCDLYHERELLKTAMDACGDFEV